MQAPGALFVLTATGGGAQSVNPKIGRGAVDPAADIAIDLEQPAGWKQLVKTAKRRCLAISSACEVLAKQAQQEIAYDPRLVL